MEIQTSICRVKGLGFSGDKSSFSQIPISVEDIGPENLGPLSIKVPFLGVSRKP